MISPTELARVEEQVQHALTTGDEGALRVIGYGEVSTVLWVTTYEGDFACKRLPRFETERQYDRFAGLLARYLAELERTGAHPARTELLSVRTEGGGIVGYCVQPSLPLETLGPRALGGASEAAGAELIERIFETVRGSVSDRLGVDGQLSNWAWDGRELQYLDVTTPLLRDEQGRDALDYGIFVASLPWLMRGASARFVAPGIAAKYFDVRQVLRDFIANLFKERLERWVPVALQRANRKLADPITLDEAKAYYRADARMWAILQRLRRWDRAWQRRVRKRPYPFLLPGDIAR